MIGVCLGSISASLVLIAIQLSKIANTLSDIDKHIKEIEG